VVNEETNAARQRFTIAHEVGHYLIEARVGFRPGTTTEYWMLEEVCQAFAAALLSPLAVVTASISPRPTDPAGLFDALTRLMATTDLSLEATARRIVEAIDAPTAIAAIDLPEGSPNEQRDGAGSLRWLHTNQPWIESGRGKRIAVGHLFSPVVVRIQESAVGARAEVKLDDGHSVWVERRGPTLGLVTAYLAA
jgi:Zn-dependent peptidase ImmA (M78 family)